MPYMKHTAIRRLPRRRRGLLGLGGYSDSDQCSVIPAGDPYRKPGNYCATPDGGMVTFNADGSVVRTPGAVDPDPAHPAGTVFQTGGAGLFNSILQSFMPGGGAVMPVPVSTGMSTTTKIALAGGAVLVVYLLASRR
jgi:hypothetical protein